MIGKKGRGMEEFDYIIVGAGSAGCVLANRLSEDPDCSVLVLEAGGRDWNPLIHIPLGTGKLVRSRLHGWGYYTEPEPHLDNRELFWPRGKVVGGSSSVNSMIYIRGHPRDYDQWAQLGNPGWSFADVLPYFKRSEGHESRSGVRHGTAGPLTVSRSSSDNPLYKAFVDACLQAGHPPCDDFNGESQHGAGRYDFTIRNGRRCSAAVAYLHPVLDRDNLTLRVRALTRRVLLEGGRAVGIEYLQGGRVKTVRARREVLLSGGALNSPQVLMLSGIGDADDLNAVGIEPKHQLPGVGKNLQDHLDVPVQHACTEPITLHSLVRVDRAAIAMLQAAMFRSGPATSFPAEGGAFVHSRPGLERPDLQWHLLLGLGSKRVRVPLLSALNRDPLEREGFTCRICHLHPDSRGRLTLRSDNPRDRVRIFANYLSADGDLAALRSGVKLAREMFQQAAFDRFKGEELAPGPEVQTDAEIDAWIRSIAETIYHPVGTCKMGVDEMAVVDPELKVRGVEALRVVDASIMPILIGGNTNGPTMMIAEKAADFIRGRESLPAETLPDMETAAA